MEPETASSELSKLGVDALRDLYANLAGLKQFALEQAPDICRQMINWQIAQGCMAVVAAAVAALVTTVLVKRAVCASADPATRYGTADTSYTVAAFCSGVAAATLSVAACVQVSASIQAVVAPKLFLLERITEMLRGM